MINEFINIAKRRLKGVGLVKKHFRKPEIGNTYGLLSQDELKYIIAISEVIYPASNMQEKKKLHHIVRKWTQDRTKKDGFLNLFQQGIELIKLLTKKNGFEKSFYDLSIAERTKIIDKTEYMKSDIYISPGFRNPFVLLKFVLSCIVNHKQNRQIFFLETLRKDLINGIFNSELGWTLVGYKTWPGISGEYLAYTKPPKTN